MNNLSINNFTFNETQKEIDGFLTELTCSTDLGTNRLFDSFSINIDDKNQTNSTGYSDTSEKCNSTCVCKRLFDNLATSDEGKIAVAFFKPIISGKILYTPNLPIINELIQKVNKTFANVDQLLSVVDQLSSLIISITASLNTTENKDTINSIIKNANLNVSLKAILTGLTSLASNLRSTNDVLRCFELNRFIGVENEYELLKLRSKMVSNETFYAAIVFEDGSKGDQLTNVSLPRIVDYKIRMNSQFTPLTFKAKDETYGYGVADNFLTNRYFYFGFVYLQDLVEKAIVEMKTNLDQDFGILAEGNYEF